MEALRCLPGVGPKSAQRMAFNLLQRNRQGGLQLADALKSSHDRNWSLSRLPYCLLKTIFARFAKTLVVKKTVLFVWSKALQIL